MFQTTVTFIKLRSNIFLTLCIILSCLYALITQYNNQIESELSSQQQSSENEINANIRIINRNFTSFNQLYYIVHKNDETWEMAANRYLEIGKQYEISFRYRELSPIQKKIAESKSQKGRIQLVSVIQEYNACGFECQWYKQQYNTRSWIERQIIYGECINISYCRENRALGVGLVLGGTNYFEAKNREQFKQYGLSHIVAVSGFQVTLMLSASEYWMYRFKLPKKHHYVVFMLLMVAFVVIIGLQPPVLRALMTSLIVILSYIFGRKVTYTRALLVSIPIMLFLYPPLLFSLSWQLSLSATFGLIALGDVIKVFRIRFKTIFELIFQPIVAWLMTFPLTSSFQSHVSLLSFAMNLMFAIVTPLLTVIHLFRLVPFVGVGADYIAHSISFVLFWAMDLGNRFPYTIQIEEYSNTQLGWYYTIFFGAMFIVKMKLLNTLIENRIQTISSEILEL